MTASVAEFFIETAEKRGEMGLFDGSTDLDPKSNEFKREVRRYTHGHRLLQLLIFCPQHACVCVWVCV